jgi:integrase
MRSARLSQTTLWFALGFKLYRAEKLLGQFLTFVEDRGEDHLTTEAALAWATLPKRGRTWAFARLSVVRRFAKHLRGIDPATEVPPTHLLVQQKGRATPYLYSESDIAALIAAAGTLRTPHRAATFRTLIALPAVTGMRVGEAIGLDRDDFDSVIGLLTIRNAKFGKSRQLPLHPSTVANKWRRASAPGRDGWRQCIGARRPCTVMDKLTNG